MSDYKPPIDVTFRDTIESIEKELVNGVENYIVSTVRKVIGVDVDKQRLINALMIDKNFVRCKDCKYFKEKTTDRRHTYRWKCEFVDHDRGWTMLPDDFCSKGERRDDST